MFTNKVPYMTENYKDKLQKKYNILDHLHMKWFDFDWMLLETYLTSIKLDRYLPEHKYIIEHVDTDYYHPEFKYGFWIYNLIKVFKQVDIPLHTILLFSNHFGIEKEIQDLAPDHNDRPTVISSFIARTHYANHYQPVDVDPDLIQYPAICMMGGGRNHRNAMFRFLQKNNLLDIVPVSVKNI